MDEESLCYLSIAELGRALRARRVSSREATRAVLDRIERLEPKLHSYARVTPEAALADAARADEALARGTDLGPLHGVPVAVKDLCDTRGVATAAGTAIYRDRVPDGDATVVARLRAAGAVILGKLQMTEGAFAAHHPSIVAPVNPWSANHWTGVSSSGSGVAAAAGLCHGALGTDTLGSIRFPSAMNGLTGLKPTRGRVSRAGVFPLAASMDHVGPMTRAAADCAAMLGAIAGADADDPTALLDPVPDYLAGIDAGVRGLRVGVDRALIEAGADADLVRAVGDACARLASLGAEVREVSVPALDQVTRDAVQLCALEAALAHAQTFPAREAEYGPVLAGLLRVGRGIDAFTLARIVHRRAEFAGRLATFFREVDVLVLPAMNEAAPTFATLAARQGDPEARHARVRFTAPFDMSGSPCLVLPGGQTADALPVGIQFVGRHLDEALLLRAGHAYQSSSDWHSRRPMIASS